MGDLLSPKQDVEKARKVTALDISAALGRYYPNGQYGVVFEVAQSTGFSANRHLDAMVMGLWPSRGLTLTGIEIKVSRSDWRRELEQPQKAEELARFCDFFYVAAPASIVPLSEVPENWGLLELGADNELHETKVAVRHKPQDVTRNLLAGVFRAATRPMDIALRDPILAARREALEKDFDARLTDEVERRRGQDKHDADMWRKLKTSITDEKWIDDSELLSAIKAVHKAGVAHSWRGLPSVMESLASARDRMADMMCELGLEERNPLDRKKRK